jgi:hypothetical protein
MVWWFAILESLFQERATELISNNVQNFWPSPEKWKPWRIKTYIALADLACRVVARSSDWRESAARLRQGYGAAVFASRYAASEDWR